MTRGRPARLALIVFSAIVQVPPAAAAANSAAPPLGDAQPVSDAELARQRGGFTWAGLDIQFGAEIRSYVNGTLALQTNVRWPDPPGRDAAAATPVLPAALQTIIQAAGGPAPSLADAKVLLADQGQTAFIQRTDGAVQNIVLNTASNVDLRQQVDMQLDVGGFAPFLTSILAARVGESLPAAGALGVMR